MFMTKISAIARRKRCFRNSKQYLQPTMGKSPSLRRIQADIRELTLDPSDRYYAMPLENDMFEWHFTIRGAEGTDFEGGLYHGRILLPPDYPFKPPHIMFLTPSGRFETNTKICLSFSAYHPELWQPAWGIRLILEALISFLPTPADGAIGALDWSSKERKRLAKQSVDWECPICGKICDLIPKVEKKRGSEKNRFQKEIDALQQLQFQEHKKDGDDSKEEDKDKDNFSKDEKDQDKDDSKNKKEEIENCTEGGDNSGIQVSKTTVASKEAPALGPEPFVTETTTVTSEAAVVPQTPLVTNENACITITPASPTPEKPAAETTENTCATNQTQELPPTATAASEEEATWPDHVLHAMIVILSIICYMLVKKVQALLEDLRALDA